MNKVAVRPGHETEQALLDAAERLLLEVGAAGITTRRVAEEAGANHGLIHYYFGSVEQLLVRVLERFTERQIGRHATYAADVPFIEKWRTAMRYLVSDDVGYEKVWLELQALAWNRPELHERVDQVNAEWRAVLMEAFAEPRSGTESRCRSRCSSRWSSRSTRASCSSVSPGSPRGTRSPRVDRRLAREEVAMTIAAERLTAQEQTRARYPDEEGYVERDGVRIFYEIYGEGEPTVLLLPAWSIIDSCHWKMQIPYLVCTVGS